MPKKKAKARKPVDWNSIRVEWETSKVEKALLANRYGVTSQAIDMRRKREGWAERPDTLSTPNKIVLHPAPAPTGSSGHLLAFHRVLELMARHRAHYARINAQVDQILDDIDRHRSNAKTKNGEPRPLSLQEADTIAGMLGKLAMVTSRLIPMERRAFGLQDQEAPSEFDALTEDQVLQLESILRQVMEP